MKVSLNQFSKITLLVSFFVLVFMQGCENKEENARNKAMQQQAAELQKLKNELEEQKNLQEKQAAEKAAKKAAAERAANAQAVINNPRKYIRLGGSCTYNVTGVVNAYINIQACYFTNSSSFPVSDISGNIIIGSGRQVGKKSKSVVLPFTASGRLEAGQTSMLPIIGIQKEKIPGKSEFSYGAEVLKATVYY